MSYCFLTTRRNVFLLFLACSSINCATHYKRNLKVEATPLGQSDNGGIWVGMTEYSQTLDSTSGSYVNKSALRVRILHCSAHTQTCSEVPVGTLNRETKVDATPKTPRRRGGIRHR